MNKFCTSLEQSKKLVELGIDIKTADMCWSIDIPDLPTLLAYPITDCDNWENKIPAWSLAALLELMPIFEVPTAFSCKISAPSLTKINRGYLSNYVGDFKIYANNGEDIESTVEKISDSSIDTVFEMVCWVLENKKYIYERIY